MSEASNYQTSYKKYLTQVKGWSDGAGRRPWNAPEIDELEKIYDLAYAEGQKNFREFSAKTANVFGVVERTVHAA